MVEMGDGFLSVAAAGDGSCIVVLSTATAGIRLVLHETAGLVKRVGEHLHTPPRHAEQPAAAR